MSTISQKPGQGFLSRKKDDTLSFGKTLATFIFTGPFWLFFLGTSVSQIASTSVLLIQTILLFYTSLMFTLEFRKPEPSPLVLMIWIFNCGVVGIPGLTQLLAGVGPWPIFLEDNQYIWAQVSTIFASTLLILLLGLPYQEKNRKMNVRNVNLIRLRNLTLIMVPAVLFATRLSGGLSARFGSRGSVAKAKSQLGVGSAVNGLFVTGSQALALVVFILALRAKQKYPKDSLINFSLITSGFGLLILANPISASRYWFFATVSAIALSAFTLTASRVRIGSMAIFYGSLFLFPIADYFRRANRGGLSISRKAWLTGDFDALQITAAGIQWFHNYGAVWGKQLLGAIFTFVPRSIWTGKPIDTGVMIAQDAGMKFKNISGPWVAEAVINFGYLGLIIFPVAIAYFFRIIQYRSAKFPDDFGILLLAFFVGYLPILLRGSLIQASGAAGLFVIFVWYATPKKAIHRDDSGDLTILGSRSSISRT